MSENETSVEEGMARVSQMLDMLLEVSFILFCCLCLFNRLRMEYNIFKFVSSPAMIPCYALVKAANQHRSIQFHQIKYVYV